MNRISINPVNFWKIALLTVTLTCYGTVTADEYINGGVTVDIDYEIMGYVIVEDATVNLFDGAILRNDPDGFMGDLMATSGATVNIYGGQIESLLYITTSYDPDLPEAVVTVFGTDFAVDGIPVDPETTELFLSGQYLSGLYENGTPFEFLVDCFWEGAFQLKLKLGWIESAPDIEVSQTEYDFGQADVGTTVSGIVSVYNLGNVALNLQSLTLEQGELPEFDFVPLQQLPMTIEAGAWVDIEILYTPAAAGAAEAILQIGSDDPEDPVVEIVLFGEGLAVDLTPAEQIAAIIDAYNQGLKDGTIEGTGRGCWAKHNSRVFGKILDTAQHLINAGYDRSAVKVLIQAENACDGHRCPADLIKGSGVEDLNTKINDLIDEMKEECKPKPRKHHWWSKWWHRR